MATDHTPVHLDAVSHRCIETNGLRIHVAEQGTGPLLLLCHGFPELWYSWRKQIPVLAEAGYHVVALDMRGYGQTDQPAEPGAYTLLHLVADLIGVLEALRGNIEGYLGASSPHKWLRVHVGNHYTPFYSEEGRAVQERFFAYWLKGQDNGLLSDPPIQLAIRRGSGYSWRAEQEWPLARTQWSRLYLDAATRSLLKQPPHVETQVSYRAPEGGVSFQTAPFETETEITGPLALRVWVSSSTPELDLFVTMRNLDQERKEVSGISTIGEPAPVAKGWLRASQRKLDPEKSLPYRPYHSHDEVQPLMPGEVVPLDVEIWPTSMVFEEGHRLILDLEAHDGVGSIPFLHTDPLDRDPAVLAGTNTIYSSQERPSFLVLPVIPHG